MAGRWSADGIEVLAVDLRPDPDGPGIAHEADLTSAEANDAAVAAALDRFGAPGHDRRRRRIQHVAPIQEFPIERWQTIIALMLTSPFLLARQGWASLVGVGRGPLHRHRLGPRAGRLALQGGLRVGQARRAGPGQDAGPGGRRGRITATAVCPGYVRTPLVEAQIPDQARAHGISEERRWRR